jgi:hypothetical protein
MTRSPRRACAGFWRRIEARKDDLYEGFDVKLYSIAEPLLVSSLPEAGRRFRCIRSRPCAPAHRLVSGESASALVPQSLFTYAKSPKAQVAGQTTTRPRTIINLPGRQPLGRWCSKIHDRISTLERGSFGDDAVLDKTPQRDRKFSASATIPTLRPRMPLEPKRSRHHSESTRLSSARRSRAPALSSSPTRASRALKGLSRSAWAGSIRRAAAATG